MLNCVFLIVVCGLAGPDGILSVLNNSVQENWHNLINSCSLFRRESISIELLFYKILSLVLQGCIQEDGWGGSTSTFVFIPKTRNMFPLILPKRKNKQVARSQTWVTCLHGRPIAKCTTSATHVTDKNIVFIMVIGLSEVQSVCNHTSD